MHRRFHAQLMGGAAAVALMAGGGAANAQAAQFDIAAQPLASALKEFGLKTGAPVLYGPALADAKVSPGVDDAPTPEAAMSALLAGTGLSYRKEGDAFLIVQAGEGGQTPQGASAGAGNAVQALIVTAQKREEDIQDVPIAISAFSQEDLTRSQVAGGPDLMTQVPNMTFTKTNFSSYSIQIRGIGTQAISATTDPAVAVAFNNTPFIRNRFFEQEFYDLERVEVLRGPQGTLYGRNATAGVVNIISAKPKFYREARASADVANYRSTRLEGMINLPLVEDTLALRIAGAWTKRDGYVTNEITGNPIDGRDLWSTRASLRFEPTDAISANLIWEHFEENDDRLRSGKQLCRKDPTKTDIAGVPVVVDNNAGQNSSPTATYNQGCLPASLYAPESFQTPNGFALPYYHPLFQLGLPTTEGLDPYASTVQSRDLRVIESTVDPQYSAKTDTVELQVRFDIGDNLTLDSETAYSVDELFSTQDYNRFNTAPGAFSQARWDGNPPQRAGVLQDGVFCDPQIGCADRLVAVDLSTADSRHFSQEFRLSSDYDGPFNFSLGANFLRYDTEDKYYVFINSLTLYAARARNQGSATYADPYVPGVADNYSSCLRYMPDDPSQIYSLDCIYIDPNPINSLNDLGHNYFLSKNPYRLISYAAFGEAYYNLAENLKVTGGLRWTVDKKRAPQIPSWLLAGGSVGHPVKEIVDVEWREPTGRLAIDWKPDLAFTDETLLYASYAHGYKAGGANPPPMVIVAGQLRGVAGVADSVLHPKTFEAEFVDAFELGSKNALFDGRATLNVSAFYYDYQGYQISQIIDRTAVNSNYDATVWGLEIEADWRPTENLRFGFKGGYEDTKVADGQSAVDVMDRTAGRTDWVVAKPFPSLPSNCVLPVSLVTFGDRINTLWNPNIIGGDTGFCASAYIEGVDPVTRMPYVANPTQMFTNLDGTQVGSIASFLSGYWVGYQGFDPASAPNNGAGFEKDLSGNELPNAPHYTATVTADYSVPLANDWLMNLHADLYWQSESWWRIFNTPGYDKLKAYTNVNLAATFTNDDAGWTVMAYVKNVMDRDSITGAFLNSDDSGLTTNVFLTEPRLYGLRVTKAFSDVPLLGGVLGDRRQRSDDEPYRFTVEIGGGVNRLQPDTDQVEPAWLPLYARPDSFPMQSQDQALDWGDQREARLIYAISDWRISADARTGVAKGEAFDSDPGARLDVCGITYPFINGGAPYCGESRVIWASSTVHDREEYSLANLAVGRSINLGERVSSVLWAGVRQAELTSQSRIENFSNPDVDFALGPLLFTSVTFHDFETTLASDRSFKGVGPVVAWEASSTLLGGSDSGRVNLDWSLGGGALFGDQKVDLTETTKEDFRQKTGFLTQPTVTSTTVTPIRQVSRSVEVPVAGASLGLSYSLDGIRLSAGYRWERYFDAIDGGFEEAKDYDRTIDGPYFKLAIGFGG